MTLRPRTGTPSVQTERLELRPGSATALRAALESNAALAAALGADVPESWPPELYDADAVRWTLEQLGDRADGGRYGFYYLIRRPAEPTDSSGALIGVGGFKGAPNAEGEVELGYGVVPEFQRQGYAAEAVRAWVALAFADPAVRTVVGQTLPSLVPSIGVLEKTGFRFAGAGADEGAPEGEQVARYELTRQEYERRTNGSASKDRNLVSICPFFIVKDLDASIAFYRDRLGFELEFTGPADGPYYAGVTRDNVGIMLKSISSEVLPQPNHSRHPWARWDAYVYTLDPDPLFEEFRQRQVNFVKELSFIDDGLWGFEITDADGYVIAFFRLRDPESSPSQAPTRSGSA